MPRREAAPKRVVKFVPTQDQREMIIKEWKTITPETQALLQRLENRSVSNAIAKKLAVVKSPARSQMVVFPTKISVKNIRFIDRIICRYVCTLKKYRVRKNQANLTRTEWSRFKCAINSMMESGAEPPTYQEFVDVHVQAMTTHTGHSWGAHGGSNFLPWHREYLMELENRLRLFNPIVTIPYWDWANNPLPVELSDPQDLARWGVTRNTTIGSMPTQTQVNNVLAQTTWDDFRTTLEGVHNTVHNRVGGDMATAGSPADPIFWLHHAYIDKVWADWQKLNPSTKPTNLSEKLQPPPIFQRTVGQVMSTASMGYVYS